MNTELDKFCNHLEFLGYKIEKTKPATEDEKEIVLAEHVQKNNLIFFEMQPNFILFRVNLTSNKQVAPEMDDFMNRANKEILLSRIYYKENDANKTLIVFEFVYTGPYSKETFSQFLDYTQHDQMSLNKIEGFERIFLD
jgi:hypothetical protein